MKIIQNINIKIRKRKRNSFLVLVYSPGSSGWPLPLSANVTTANAIATPIAEPICGHICFCHGRIRLEIEYNVLYHNFQKL